MKQCPNCRNTYTDSSLKFCLADGAKLVSLADADKTIAMNTSDDKTVAMEFETDPVRVDIPIEDSTKSVSTVISPPISAATVERKGVSPAIVGVLATLLVLLVIGFAGFVGYTFLNQNSDASTNSKVTAELETPAPNDELANLKKEIANLKELADANEDTVKKPDVSVSPTSSGNTARVNSPRDRFLALRSEPDTETGFRVMQIPHNSTITIISCNEVSYIGKTRGRWCDVTYTDQRGWVFDAYLKR